MGQTKTSLLGLDKERRKILSWLAPSTMPQHNYDGALEKCLEHTASWIFEQDVFMNWKQGNDSLLRLIGMRKLYSPYILMVC